MPVKPTRQASSAVLRRRAKQLITKALRGPLGKSPSTFQERVKYLIAFLALHPNDADVRKVAGVGSTKFRTRLIDRLVELGDLHDKPHSVKPRVLTPEVFQLAYDYLINSKKRLTALDVQRWLIRRKKLPCLQNQARFNNGLKAYCKQKGNPLTVGSTSSKFLITKQDKKDRVEFCGNMLALIAEHGLDNIVFVDETPEYERPPGKAVHVRAAGACDEVPPTAGMHIVPPLAMHNLQGRATT